MYMPNIYIYRRCRSGLVKGNQRQRKNDAIGNLLLLRLFFTIETARGVGPGFVSSDRKQLAPQKKGPPTSLLQVVSMFPFFQTPYNLSIF